MYFYFHPCQRLGPITGLAVDSLRPLSPIPPPPPVPAPHSFILCALPKFASTFLILALSPAHFILLLLHFTGTDTGHAYVLISPIP